jgi:hypothetical protein
MHDASSEWRSQDWVHFYSVRIWELAKEYGTSASEQQTGERERELEGRRQ